METEVLGVMLLALRGGDEDERVICPRAWVPSVRAPAARTNELLRIMILLLKADAWRAYQIFGPGPSVTFVVLKAKSVRYCGDAVVLVRRFCHPDNSVRKEPPESRVIRSGRSIGEIEVSP
jgi:hypothetical protein